MTELQEQMTKDLQECPVWIINESVSALKNYFTQDEIKHIQREYNNDPELWWAKNYFHFGWGMNIRNYLRDNVCLGDKLPLGNWDEYYIQMVEIVCELRRL